MSRRVTILIAFVFAWQNIMSQTINTFAGGGSTLGDGGPATAAQTSLTFAGSFDGFGNYYFATNQTRIRKINLSGVITTVAGNGTAGYSGDSGPATAANIHYSGMDVDSVGNIYIADWYNSRIRRVDAVTGIITTIAGNGTGSSTGDGGPASAATINSAEILVTRDGRNIYLSGDNRIRKIDASGIITTIAGTGSSGYSGDGGPATAALVMPGFGLCFDLQGNLVFSAQSGCRIRRVNLTTGIISAVAGSGLGLFNGDGIRADTANFNAYDVTYDELGNLYLADIPNARVRVIDNFGIIHTAVGTGIGGFSGDGGPATAAQINYPEGIAFDACGNLYIADDANNRIRKVSYPPNTQITITSSPSMAAIGSSVTINCSLYHAGYTPTIKWYNRGVLFATTSAPTVTYTKAICTDSITARVYGCNDSALSAVHVVGCNLGASSPGPFSTSGEGVVACRPNPVGGTLWVQGMVPLQTVVITNVLGTAVATQQCNGATDTELDVSQLPPGIYLVKVNGVYVEKVVKE